jgi:hypothetical protein
MPNEASVCAGYFELSDPAATSSFGRFLTGDPTLSQDSMSPWLFGYEMLVRHEICAVPTAAAGHRADSLFFS